MKTTPIALAALALLAACSDDSATPTAETSATPATAEQPSPAATPEARDTIPAAYLGTWDYVDGTCDPMSDLLLEISPEQMIFYESMGEVRSVTQAADAIIVDLAMTGEGESWDNTQTFRLTDGGTILESDQPGVGGAEKLRRKKCEG